MSGQYQCMVLDYPTSQGVEEMMFAFSFVGFRVDRIWTDDLVSNRLEQDQLCLRYKVIALPSFLSIRSRWLALHIDRIFGWNLKRFVERGGLILGVGASMDSLVHLDLFGDELSVHRKRNPLTEESWVNVSPTGSKCEWLKGSGSLTLPIDSEEPTLVVSDSSRVELEGRLQRLGMSCLKKEGFGEPDAVLLEKTMGLTDATGRILSTFLEPQYAVQMGSQHLIGTGPGAVVFQNALRAAQAS